MKSLKKISQRTEFQVYPPRRATRPWGVIALSCMALFTVILYLYWPALNGHFIFDDTAFPFCTPVRHSPLAKWISTVGVRPVLVVSYWLNYHFWGESPFSFHFANVVIHFVNSALVFLVLRRLLQKAGWAGRKPQLASAVGALIFAIHPLQTESVSYVAGRSESLASFFLLLAYAIFLYRRQEAISWGESLLVLALFAMGVKTKENAVSLAPVLLLTDLFWPVAFSLRGVKRNWRLYGLMIPGVAVAGVLVFRMLAAAHSAGFSAASFKWYQYAFTEARAIFAYIRMAIWPAGLSLDHDFATSHTIWENGALWWILLLAALVVTAVIFRRRFPLTCFGLLMFLLWLAPTSSVIPLDDALVERRMYLPLMALILIGCELAMRVRIPSGAGVAVLCVAAILFGKLSYDRNRLWGEPDKLIEMAAANAQYNPRPLLNYAEILIQHNQCGAAPQYLVRAEKILPHNYFVNVLWGRSFACLGYFDNAVKRFQVAAQLKPGSQVYQWLGLAYAEMGRSADAGASLKKAVELDSSSGPAHGSLALWYEKNRDFANAEQEYRIAASLDSDDTFAQQGAARAHEEARQTRGTF